MGSHSSMARVVAGRAVEGYICHRCGGEFARLRGRTQLDLCPKCDAFERAEGQPLAPDFLPSHKTPTKHDPVERPAHYNKGGFELTDIIIAWGLNWCRGNVLKYVLRAGKKTGDELQDLEKSRWYLDREIQRLKEERGALSESD